MHDSSIFNIKIDFEKSKGSYIYDKNRERSFLDFFGLYSSLPLGYNHPIFDTAEFKQESQRIAGINVPNCEIISDEAQDFLKEFSSQPAMSPFAYFHFCCTGALAIEAAIKIAIDQKGARAPMVLSLKESFHGINSYGGFVTDRFPPVNQRLDGFPDMGWKQLINPKLIYENNKINERATNQRLKNCKKEFESCLNEFGAENISAFVVEPIQSTYGDNYFSAEFFRWARDICDKYEICLIFDEIQTGFGATGKMWYYEHLDIIPDIIAFGKKAQISGVMVKESFKKTFQTPIRLEVTWDGNLMDMVRSKYVLKAYEQYQVFDNVQNQNEKLMTELGKMSTIKNLRATGLLVAFDFDTEELRNTFFVEAVNQGLICNKTRDISIRLRPNLCVSGEEVEKAIEIITSSANILSGV